MTHIVRSGVKNKKKAVKTDSLSVGLHGLEP